MKLFSHIDWKIKYTQNLTNLKVLLILKTFNVSTTIYLLQN